MPPFAAEIVSWEVTGDMLMAMCSVHHTSTLRKPPFVLETTNHFLE